MFWVEVCVGVFVCLVCLFSVVSLALVAFVDFTL